MSIDWFTVAAQALNFAVLVWLLKRMLYKPILAAIDAREARIAAELADADAKKAEGQKERDEFHGKNRDFDQQRAELLTQATTAAKAEQERLLAKAKAAAEELQERLQAAVESDAKNVLQSIGQRVQREVFAVAHKVLSDLASASLEESVCEVFAQRLGKLQGDDKQRLSTALKSSHEPVVVRSAFALPLAGRVAIETAFSENLSAPAVMRFERSADLVFGIELTTNGEKLAWSAAEYLTTLEDEVAQLAKPSVKPAPAVKPPPASATAASREHHA